MSETKMELTVGESDAGMRLDRWLASQIADVSRSAIQRWIAEGRVTVDGAAAPAKYLIAGGQVVAVRRPPPDDNSLLPEDIPLDVIYEDEHLAVIDKPAGMVVHPGTGVHTGTLANALLHRYPWLEEMDAGEADDEEPSRKPPRPGIVHRLDKDTSGLIVAAKSADARDRLQAQFGERSVEKVYLALVQDVPAPEGQVNAPIGRDPRKRKRMAVVRDGRPALTEYRVVETYGQYALLEVSIKTGRTHQIRVHMAFVGHPVVGDTVYGRRKGGIACPRQFLHAHRIAFRHPMTGEDLAFTAPLPADLQAVLDRLREGLSPGVENAVQ